MNSPLGDVSESIHTDLEEMQNLSGSNIKLKASNSNVQEPIIKLDKMYLRNEGDFANIITSGDKSRERWIKEQRQKRDLADGTIAEISPSIVSKYSFSRSSLEESNSEDQTPVLSPKTLLPAIFENQDSKDNKINQCKIYIIEQITRIVVKRLNMKKYMTKTLQGSLYLTLLSLFVR